MHSLHSFGEWVTLSVKYYEIHFGEFSTFQCENVNNIKKNGCKIVHSGVKKEGFHLTEASPK